jgi:hypothetical protein
MARARFSARFLCVVVLLIAAVPAGRLFAQSALGSISGNVVDASGGAVPGAAVTVRNVDTGAVRTATSGVSGSFTFPQVPSGNYTVSGELSGFSPAKITNVIVSVGGDATVSLKLDPAGVQASVTVSSEAPLIETTKTQVSSVVNEKMIQSLPTNGRNFLDVVLSTPGVVKDNFRVGDLVFAGQRGTLNSVVVDGADNNNTFFGQALGRTGSGRAPYQFSLDSVKEFQVNTNAYSAEYGRAGGAVINVVTKSGTNEFHGNGFYFYRDESLNAKNYFDAVNGRAKAPYHFDQFGATLGGPVIPDKLFFFANYDGQRNQTPNTVVLSIPANTPTDPDTIAGIAKLTALAGNWNQKQDQDVFLFKADYEIASGHHASLRYNHQDFTGQGFESSGATVAFEHSGDSIVKTDTLAGTLSSSFTPTLFNELRGQYAKDGEPGTANSSKPEGQINQSGAVVLTIGENFFSPRETTIKRWQIADAATYLFADHTFKGGFDYQHEHLQLLPGELLRVLHLPEHRLVQPRRAQRVRRALRPGVRGPGHDRPGHQPQPAGLLRVRAGRVADPPEPDGERRAAVRLPENRAALRPEYGSAASRCRAFHQQDSRGQEQLRPRRRRLDPAMAGRPPRGHNLVATQPS